MSLSILGDALRRRDEIDPALHLMPIGKHKGTPLGEIPDDYLRWFLSNLIHRHADRWQVNNELLRRATSPWCG